MNITEITSDYSVASQITVAEVEGIASLGFRAIMCNRPDGESPDQTGAAEIRAEAQARGLAFSHVPVVSGNIGPEDVSRFAEALASLPAPVLAYCRSGARCRQLWSFSH